MNKHNSFRPTIRMGGVERLLANSLILNFVCNAANGYFRLNDKAGNAYQVPVGKKLVLHAHSSNTNATTGISGSFGYSDTAPPNTTTVPTNSQNTGPSFFSGANSLNAEMSASYEVPAGKYPYIVMGSAGTISGRVLASLEDV